VIGMRQFGVLCFGSQKGKEARDQIGALFGSVPINPD
jgi:hypothetical protein